MELMLRNKVAIVTGASKGIGMAVTEALADEGVLVVAAARRVSSLQGLEGVTAIAVDLFDAGAPASLSSEHWKCTAGLTSWSTILEPQGFGSMDF